MIEVKSISDISKTTIYKVEKLNEKNVELTTPKVAQALRGATLKWYGDNSRVIGFNIVQSLNDPDRVLSSSVALYMPFFVSEVKPDTFIPAQEDYTSQFTT